MLVYVFLEAPPEFCVIRHLLGDNVLCTLEGFLPPEREAGYRTRMAAETRPVIGVLIHDHYARTGNLEHVDALLRAIQARGGVPYALSDSFAADHGTEQGILYRMERFYRGRWWCPTASA